jgi:hypothetical protein
MAASPPGLTILLWSRVCRQNMQQAPLRLQRGRNMEQWLGWIRNFAPRINFVFREIFSLFREIFSLFREISRPSFAKFREIKMEIVSEISRN